MKYKTINGWTKESMVQHIKDNFKGKSIDGDFCLYRGPNGTKCAVGLFIPDEMYDSEIERHPAINVLRTHARLREQMPLNEVEMTYLQNIHDDRTQEESTVLPRMLDWIENNVE